jgi:ferredoxin-NADP reductase
MVEQELRVKELIPRTYNVKSVRVEAPIADFQAGQFLQVTLNSDPGLKRYLSISNSPTEIGYLEFTKKITESDFSRALSGLRPGDSAGVKYPFGKFTLEGSPAKIAFISGGIGITPIRSMCKFAADKNLAKDIILIYANRSINDIAFKDDFARMEKDYPKLRVVHVLGEVAGDFQCKVGRVDKCLISEVVADYSERRFYLCGPPAMVEAMRKILSQELLLSENNIVTENFQGY